MSRLSFQDAFFLRAESATAPAHVAALMIFRLPADATSSYLRRLAAKLARVHKAWPILGRKLKNPRSVGTPTWTTADDFDPDYHILHYVLPAPGRMPDLLRLVERAHEHLLDRGRPLWQMHVIGGLAGDRFALYFKVHHAVIDGVGGLSLIRQMLSEDPRCHTLGTPAAIASDTTPERNSVASALGHSIVALQKQSRALPEALSVLARLGWESLLGNKNAPLPPFAAPRTRLNAQLDARRCIQVCELPLKQVRVIGRRFKATVNDVLVAICGGALRDYLLSLDELPAKTLDAGLPVSIKGEGGESGNQLSFIVCPFATDEPDPVKRLRRIVRATRKAKADIGHMSPAATGDLASIVMLPFLLMSLTHTSQSLPPVFNTIVSNVPGPERPLYLDGSKLEHLYPLSVITDGLGLNITVISYTSRLCVALTSCPTGQPGIESLAKGIRAHYRALLATPA